LTITPKERADPRFNGSRRLRIAKAGRRSEVNRLLDQFQQMRKLLQKV
jgi:signal recognition particle GTPase